MKIAQYIEHTLLKPEATEDDIRKLCQEAQKYDFITVCVNPTYVPLAVHLLQKSRVKVCTVVGFPSGSHVTEVKALETCRAIQDGAEEIDMVIDIGAMKNGDEKAVHLDIKAVVDICRDKRVLVKVIIEAALLTDEEKIIASQIARQAGADFVKTSTGFGPGGATVHDVALMKKVIRGFNMKIKAAGGIRTYADALKMIEAGANRIGTSSGVQIVEEEKRKKNEYC